MGIVEDARDRHRLPRLGDPHEALGGDELDERELGLQRDRRGQRGLAGARRALEEDGKERGALRAFELADEAVRTLEQLRQLAAVGDDAAAHATLQLVGRHAERGLHFLQSADEVGAHHLCGYGEYGV